MYNKLTMMVLLAVCPSQDAIQHSGLVGGEGFLVSLEEFRTMECR